MDNNAITEIPKDLLGTEEIDPKTSHEKSTSIEISDISNDVFDIDYQALPQSELPTLREDRTLDPTKFDFQLKLDADNEEIRAKQQTGWQLARNSGAQILGLGVGGMISGFGYMGDIFSNLPELIRGEEIQFNNILTQFGEGLTNWSQEVAPVHQTRRAQESGWRAMGDATWWAGNAPTLASSLAIMVPTYAATRGVSALGRVAGKGIASATAGTKVADRLSPHLRKLSENRRARGIIDHAGNTVLSRHTYNSLEANDTFEQEYLESLQKGLSEEEAKKRAGQAAAAMYRIGYMNIWKDALQWRLILGRNYASAGATGQLLTNAGASTTARRTFEELSKRFPAGIPRETIRRVGIGASKGKNALKKVAKMGFLEGIEEINIQHQKMLARNYIDDITGNIGEPGTGWKDVYSNLLSNYIPSLADFVYDEDSIISPEAFDAAFWAFGSGVAMGGMMKAVQPRMDNLFGGSEAAQQAKNLAQLKYFKAQASALQKAEMEGNKPLAEKIADETIFSLAIGGKLDGQTHVEGALSDSRLSDLQSSLEQIISSDDQTLENNGIPNDEASRRYYERMLADVNYIGERFNHHYEKTANLADSDARALSTALSYYEYMQKRINERLTDFRQQADTLKSEIDTSVLSEGYESLIEPSLKLRGLKRAIQQIDEYISNAGKAESEFTSDEVSKEKVIAQYEMAKSIAQSIVEQTTNEINEIRENLDTSKEKDDVFKGLLENQDALTDLNEFIGAEETSLEVYKHRLAELYTDKGKNKFINERKKRISENRNKEKQAQIALATTKQQLKDLSEGIKTYSNETQQIFQDQSEIISQRDKAAKNVDAPDISQEYVDEISERVPTMSDNEFTTFEQEINARDIHGNTKNAIIKYATDVFNASRNAVEQVENKILLRDLKNEIKKEHKSLVDTVFSQPTRQKASDVINKSDVDQDTKDILYRIVNDYYKRRTDRIPKESQEKLQEDAETKEVSEGKEQVEHTFELDKEDTQVEHTFTAEETDVESESSTMMSAKDQYGKVGEDDWRLNFIIKDKKLRVKNRVGDYFKNRRAGVDYHMQSHPGIKVGDNLELILLNNGNIAYKHDVHENPIGVLRAKGGTPAERRQYDIVKEALKSGKKVSGKIVDKKIENNNINNIKIDNKTFVRDLSKIESNQFTRKADGSIVREDRPVILVSSRGLPEAKEGAKLEINKEYYPFLDPEIIAEINSDIEGQSIDGRHGHIWAVFLNPYGKWEALNIVTRFLDQNAQEKAFDFLTKGDLKSANSIVNIEGNLNDQTRTDLFLSAYVFDKSTNTFRIDYYDENKGHMVRLSKNTTEKGSQFTVQFQDKTQPEKVNKKDIREYNFEQTKQENFDWQDGLKKLLARKRYNVDRSLIGSTDQQYFSPLTGKTHDSYYDYVTKDNVWKGTDEYGGTGKNILGSDLYSEDGSLWSNHGIEVEANIDQSPQTPKTKIKEEYTKPEVVDTQTQTQIDSMDFLDDFSDVSDIETSRDKAISEAFNQHKDTFKKGNKYLSLEEFANDVFQKELFTEEQIKKHAEAVAQNIINCK